MRILRQSDGTVTVELDRDRFERLVQVLTRIAEGIERLIPPLPTEDLNPSTAVAVDEEQAEEEKP